MFLGIGLSIRAQLLSGGALSAYVANGITPPVVADFTADTFARDSAVSTFADVFEHSRADATTIATYVDSTGTMQTVSSAGDARTDHHVWNGSAWVKTFLVEEASTNATLNSIMPTEMTAVQGAVATGQTDVFGGATARQFLADTSTNLSFYYQNHDDHATTLGQDYTFSVSVKPVGAQQFIAYGAPSYGFANGARYAVFDIINGTVTDEETNVVGRIETLRDGYFRVSVTTPATSTKTTNLGNSGDHYIIPHQTGTLSFTGYAASGSDGFVCSAFQREAASFPSSYIPTAGTTVTRAADVWTLPIANAPYPTGSPLAVSFAMEGFTTGEDSTFLNWTADASNGILAQSGASSFTFTQEAGGVVDTVTGGAYTSGVNVPFSIASRHGSTFINGAVSGTVLTADTTPVAFPSIAATDIDLCPTGSFAITKFRMWGDATGDIGDVGIAETSSIAPVITGLPTIGVS